MPLRTSSVVLALPAVPDSVRRARAEVMRLLDESVDSERFVDDVRLCVSEAVTNVVRHAYGAGVEGEVGVVAERTESELRVLVRDDGRGFGFETRAEEAREGGYGLEIIEKLTNRLAIRPRADGGAEVEMVFLLPTGRRSR